jgi:hypothetical protein
LGKPRRSAKRENALIPSKKNQMLRKMRKAKNKKRDSQIEEEMEEILAPIFPPPNNKEPIYNPTSIMEPTAVREYTQLPLESRAIPNIQPSAPIIQQHQLATESNYPTRKTHSEKIYPSLATKLANIIPHPKFNQSSHHKIKSDDNQNALDPTPHVAT